MFYEYPIPEITGNITKALITLTPAESKRLIAKGVAAMPEVKKALETGIIIIARGTTNTYVVEEITQTNTENKAVYDDKIVNKGEYSRGVITHGELNVNQRRGTGNDFVLKDGRVFDIAATLSDELLRHTFEMGMGCILKTLAHLRDAEQWWYENWHNGGAFEFDQIKRETTIQELHQAYTQTIADRDKYFANLADGDLDRTVTATLREGQTLTFTLGESMLQLCGHGTHHRAQIINMFRHSGAEVPVLGYITMKRQVATA